MHLLAAVAAVGAVGAVGIVLFGLRHTVSVQNESLQPVQVQCGSSQPVVVPEQRTVTTANTVFGASATCDVWGASHRRRCEVAMKPLSELLVVVSIDGEVLCERWQF